MNPLIPSLARWGLSQHADLIYRVLIANGPAPNHELARPLGLSPARTAAALEELAGATAATRSGDHWTGLPPAAVSQRLHARAVRIATSRFQLRQRLGSLSGWQETLPTAHTPHLDNVILLRDKREIRRRLLQSVDAVAHEQLAMNPEAAIPQQTVQAQHDNSRAALVRGVRARVLGIPAAPEDESGSYDAELSSFRSVYAYHEVPTLPAKLVIFDRRIAVIPAQSTNYQAGAWYVTDANTISDLVRYFETWWETSRPGPTADLPQLTTRERAILLLLAAGHTDVSAARALRISQRTVAYALRDLMDRYHVENRLQLGVVLGARLSIQDS